MKTLFNYLKKYKKESMLAPIFKLLEVVFDLIVPIVVASIIDKGVANGDNGYIVKGFFMLLLMALMGLLSSFTAQFFAAKASTFFAADLRQAVFDRIQKFSFSKLDDLSADTLITRLTTDINQVQNGLNMGLRLLLRSPFIVVGATVMAFCVNVKCAIIFAASVPVLFAVIYFIMIISIPLYKKVQISLDNITRITRENLTGMRVIRAFCREKDFTDEFKEGNDEVTRLNIFVGKISALLNPLTYVLINIATVLLLKRASVQVNTGNMAQGEVVALYNYMMQIIIELIKLAALIITINKSIACARRVESVLKTEPGMEYKKESILNEGRQKENQNGGSKIEFKNVSFTYDGAGAPSISDISFSIKKGECVGIIGGTGSGKSTLAHLAARFYDADKGEILIDGANIKNYSKSEINKKVSVVLQKPVLFSQSVRDNLKWGDKNADDASLWKALEIAQAKDVVMSKKGQLDFLIEQNGKNLSGGQRQRIAIARSLLKKSEILIFDDSLSALDYATDAALREALKKNLSDTTTVFITQRISGIIDADTILVMDNGRIAGKGTHEYLLKNCEVYREIYYSQFPDDKGNEKSQNAFSGGGAN